MESALNSWLAQASHTTNCRTQGHDKMDIAFQHLLLLWYEAYDSVKICKADEECSVYICEIEPVTAVLIKIAFSAI